MRKRLDQQRVNQPLGIFRAEPSLDMHPVRGMEHIRSRKLVEVATFLFPDMGPSMETVRFLGNADKPSPMLSI